MRSGFQTADWAPYGLRQDFVEAASLWNISGGHGAPANKLHIKERGSPVWLLKEQAEQLL